MRKKLKYNPDLKVKIYNNGTKGPVMEVYGGSIFGPRYSSERDDFHFIDNEPFKAKLTLVKFIKSASSFKLVLRDENNVHYYMRHADYTNMVLNTNIIDATVEDTFVFVEQNNFPYIAPQLGRELCPSAD